MSTVDTAAPQDLIGSNAAAARLRVDPRTVVRWCRAGRLPSYRIGGRWKMSAAELEAWIVGARYCPPPPAPLVSQLAGQLPLPGA